MNNVINLDAHRKPSEARTETEEELGTITVNISCDACKHPEMFITDVSGGRMAMECVNCSNVEVYTTDKPLLP